MRRLQLLVLIAACGLATGRESVADEELPTRPNVLIILADDMGFSDVGCYGGEVQTPNIDALAERGLRFTQFYNTARCWPTRAAIMTGYYAQQVRRDALPGSAKGGTQGVRPTWAPLLPARLRPLGYRSYHAGKWHIDGSPLENGFDHAYVIEDHNNFFRPQRHLDDDRPLPPIERDKQFYLTTAIADYALKHLREHAEQHGDQPFFQYLCFTAPHFPLHAMAQDIDRYRDVYTSGWDIVQASRGERLRELGIVRHDPPPIERQLGPPHKFAKLSELVGPNEVDRPLAWRELNEDQRAFQAEKMAIHAAMIDRMDREIGRVIEQLQKMGVLDNTLILFLSDNGASAELLVRGEGHDPQAPPGSADTFLCLGPGWSSAANTPLRRHKTWVHEGGISTPLVVHWPRGISARGELRHAPAHVIDIPVTIVELAGGQFAPLGDAPPAPGKSLTGLFQADSAGRHADLWWMHEGHRAIRMGDWKLVANKDEPWELYNLREDRGETTDLAEQFPERARELEALWNRRAEEFRKQAEAPSS
jgi:arylsulfatase